MVVLFAAPDEVFSGIVSDSCFAKTPEMIKSVLIKTSKILTAFTPGALCIGKLIYGLELISVIDLVSSITCPILFIHGGNDDGVPVISQRFSTLNILVS